MVVGGGGVGGGGDGNGVGKALNWVVVVVDDE